MLTSHAGEIFIHTLGIARSVIEDPPSISEGPGGKKDRNEACGRAKLAWTILLIWYRKIDIAVIFLSKK